LAKIKAFENNSEHYEEWFENNPSVYASEINALKKNIPITSKGIEIGIGSGRFAIPFNIRFGIDPSLTMLNISLKKGLKVINGIAESLPITNNYFDYVLMVTTICFVDDIKKTFNEAYRIIKDNGYIIIGFVDKNSLIGKLYQQKKNKSLFYKEATFFSTSEITEYLKESGFTNFDYSQTIFKNLADISNIEPVLDGYGKGSFVVIKAKKRKD
jgi:ubiquinone/menaquinone biosynthesis C-methylase UbiE